MSKILIVDDSPTEQHVISKLLMDAGYQTIAASNGEEGIQVAQNEQPDLILMDVVMPGLNGFQATRKLTHGAETKDIPVIMVTTKDQDTDREWAMRQGALDYIIKPIDTKEILKKIAAALET